MFEKHDNDRHGKKPKRLTDWQIWVTKMLKTLVRLTMEGGDIIMAKIDDLQAALDSIPPVIDAIAADQASLVAEIQALKDVIAAGGAVTDAQVQSALDKATAVKDRLDAVDASVPVPVPVP